MKLPRDESGSSLVMRLKQLGYTVKKQTGSHIRLTTQENGEHIITIPDHKSIKLPFKIMKKVRVIEELPTRDQNTIFSLINALAEKNKLKKKKE